ncbi:MAG: N-acetylmuramoyl-L-alanine amidase [Thiomicrorhabdus sp.]|nr:N-acetylmuramoyl-L-alanine amidase [Thiomicrorhabdus sp.]
MILISAGHYPEKPGACYKGFCEFDEANRWVDEIIKYLPEDVALKVPPNTLKHKVAFINARNPTIAVEIHFNAAVDSTGKNVGSGALCLHYPDSVSGFKYASEIHKPLVDLFGSHWDGVMEGYYRMNKKFGVDFFLAKTKCPAVIVEPEFIHRKEKIIENRAEACKRIAHTLGELVK